MVEEERIKNEDILAGVIGSVVVQGIMIQKLMQLLRDNDILTEEVENQINEEVANIDVEKYIKEQFVVKDK